MKKYINFGLFLMLISLSACEKEKFSPETSLEPFTILFPEENTSINLEPSSNAVVTFEWEESRAADGTLVFYELLFDEENGNFLDPAYTSLSEGEGVENTFSISHQDLNEIASNVGIEPLERGNISMKVRATNGINEIISKDILTLELERPGGFDENPDKLYLFGSGTEAGTNIDQAIPFKKLSDGRFEIYTSLSEGTLTFVDQKSEDYKSFFWDGENIRSGSEGESITNEEKIYHILLDFNNGSAQFIEIQSVGLWIAAKNQVTEELFYAGNGVWKAEGVPIIWADVSWGKDERYKFLVTEKNANGEVSNIFWGSSNKDNGRPNDDTSESYYYLDNSGDTSQWDYTYKFAWESTDNDIIVRFQGLGEYTHEIIRNQ